MPTEQDAETVRQGHALIADTFLGEHQPASRLSHGVASRLARQGCAVPVGLFKAMQVMAGLALPKDISIRVSQV